SGVLLLVLIGQPAGGDVAFGEEIAGTLIQPDVVRRRRSGGVPHARGGVEHDQVLVSIHGGFGGARLVVVLATRLRLRSSAVGSVRVFTLVARKLSTRFCGP